mmetsp:Transcript_85754/g.223783  ORF Transcript_85754/g.223783 Transcript_85754/m.223783 type:complete len:310 (-) Transcript_85754:389-1318(-)
MGGEAPGRVREDSGPLRLLLYRPLHATTGGLPGGDLGPLDHGAHLLPDELLWHVHGPGSGGEAAVGAGHHALHADQADVIQQALRHQPGVLDVRSGGVQNAWEQDLVMRQLDRLEDLPLVRVPWVAGLQRYELGLHAQDGGRHIRQRHVGIVGARVVAPAHVHPALLCRDVRECLVHHIHVQLCGLLELLHALLLECRVPAHGQVRAVHLQAKSGGRYALVLGLHGLAQGADVLLVCLVIFPAVREEGRQRPWGGRRKEVLARRLGLGSIRARYHAGDTLDLALQVLEPLGQVADLAVAGWVLDHRLLL